MEYNKKHSNERIGSVPPTLPRVEPGDEVITAVSRMISGSENQLEDEFALSCISEKEERCFKNSI
jgi:hypothetical protein